MQTEIPRMEFFKVPAGIHYMSRRADCVKNVAVFCSRSSDIVASNIIVCIMHIIVVRKETKRELPNFERSS